MRAEATRQGSIHFEQTSAPGDEERLATSALAGGAEAIVAVGGDGTCSRIANAILRSGRPCRLAVIPSGTGNDFAKTLGVRNLEPKELLELVQRGNVTRIDLGRVDGHYFLNSCGFGFDASVLDASNKVRFLKGDAVYIYSALAQLLTYRGVDVKIDGTNPSRLLMVTVSNGRMLGGVFRIAPTASVIDGELDVAYFANCGLFQRIMIFAGAFRGTHLRLASVRSEKRSRLTLELSEPPSMEVDGELLRANTRSVSIECVRGALAVVVAPGAAL